jgi:hypothetical protein
MRKIVTTVAAAIVALVIGTAVVFGLAGPSGASADSHRGSSSPTSAGDVSTSDSAAVGVTTTATIDSTSNTPAGWHAGCLSEGSRPSDDGWQPTAPDGIDTEAMDVAVSTTNLHAGSKFTVNISGAKPGSPFEVSMGGDSLGQFTADRYGSAQCGITAPSHGPAGSSESVTVTDQHSGRHQSVDCHWSGGGSSSETTTAPVQETTTHSWAKTTSAAPSHTRSHAHPSSSGVDATTATEDDTTATVDDSTTSEDDTTTSAADSSTSSADESGGAAAGD